MLAPRWSFNIWLRSTIYCHDEVNRNTVISTWTSSQSSDSFESNSSHDNLKPSKSALRNMVPLDARIYKAKYVSYAFIFLAKPQAKSAYVYFQISLAQVQIILAFLGFTW